MYARLVERLLDGCPGLGLGTDLIAGFPGETDADFDETLRLVEASGFSYLHVFPYSDRSGTEAARRPDHVPSPVIAERSRRLRELGRARSLAFRERLLGTVQEVLVLSARDRATGRLTGLTGNFVEVAFPGPDLLMGSLTKVRITGVHAQGTDGAPS